MTTLADLAYTEIARKLKHEGVRIKVGPFHVSVQSKLATIAHHLHEMYAFSSELDDAAFIDFHLTLNRPSNLRRWIKPQIVFSFDGFEPFTPLPLNQACAQLEWGLNWCIAGHSHHYAIIHSAVVEKNGLGLIIPGAPGSGKSTLCAGLVLSGWRLLSDEMALISLEDLKLHPVPRPISLKNVSIDIIREFDSSAKLGEIVSKTSKGNIAHLQADKDSISRQEETVSNYKILYPTFSADSALKVEPVKPAESCMKLIENCFNFNILGSEGFNTLTNVIDKSESFGIQYKNMEQAFQAIETITQ